MILKQMTTYRNAEGQHIRVTESTMQSLPKTAILHALWSFLNAIWKNGGSDIFSGIVLVAVIIAMFSLSFTPGECDGEFSPVLCIDVTSI